MIERTATYNKRFSLVHYEYYDDFYEIRIIVL